MAIIIFSQRVNQFLPVKISVKKMSILVSREKCIYIYVKVALAIEDGLSIEGEVPTDMLSVRQ